MNHLKSTNKKPNYFYELDNIIHQHTTIVDKIPIFHMVQMGLSVFSFTCTKIKFDSCLVIN